jgi:hypothetical protein
LGCPAIREIKANLIDVTPSPSFRRIVAFDDRVPGGVKVLVGVPVRRVIAAAHVSTGAAQAQVYPDAPRLETFFAAQRARRYRLDAAQV